MKKIFVLFSLSLMIYACGNSDSGTTTGADTTATTPAHVEPAVKDVTENPDYVAGLELIAKYDCLTCHKVEEKVIGPSYREVANKYTSDDKTIELLSEKVIKGGSGVWGPVMMTPHPQIPKDEVTKMIKYILLLKK